MYSSIRTQIGVLVVATSVVQLANGFFGTYISLRVAVEGFDVPGLVLSAYFAGFTLGALVCNRVIERIGHIRAYAAFAGLVAAAVALMPLLITSLAWVSLRAIIGFGCAGIFVTTESWRAAMSSASVALRAFGSADAMVKVFDTAPEPHSPHVAYRPSANLTAEGRTDCGHLDDPRQSQSRQA